MLLVLNYKTETENGLKGKKREGCSVIYVDVVSIFKWTINQNEEAVPVAWNATATAEILDWIISPRPLYRAPSPIEFERTKKEENEPNFRPTIYNIGQLWDNVPFKKKIFRDYAFFVGKKKYIYIYQFFIWYKNIMGFLGNTHFNFIFLKNIHTCKS